MKFNVKCSQKLDDGDTALVEEYNNLTEDEIGEIVESYHDRATSKSYVVSYNITVEINRS